MWCATRLLTEGICHRYCSQERSESTGNDETLAGNTMYQRPSIIADPSLLLLRSTFTKWEWGYAKADRWLALAGRFRSLPFVAQVLPLFVFWTAVINMWCQYEGRRLYQHLECLSTDIHPSNKVRQFEDTNVYLVSPSTPDMCICLATWYPGFSAILPIRRL